MTGGWRPMRAGDLPAVVAIADAVHGIFTEPAEIYAERLALYPDGCRSLEKDTAVVGFLITHPWHRVAVPKIGALLGEIPDGTDIFYLHDIALLPAARGSGFGAAATAFVHQQARRAGCATIRLVAVNGADTYWQAQGFEYVGSDMAGPYGEGSYLMERAVRD